MSHEIHFFSSGKQPGGETEPLPRHYALGGNFQGGAAVFEAEVALFQLHHGLLDLGSGPERPRTVGKVRVKGGGTTAAFPARGREAGVEEG